MDYVWLDDKSPILRQLPSNFNSAAILLHPFVQMPSGWTKSKQQDPYEHIYPNDEEILNLATPVSWEKVIHDCDLKTPAELAMALKTSISALNKKYTRPDLAEKLISNLAIDLYYPTDDSISLFLISEIIKVLGFKGAKNFYFSDPIFDNHGVLKINEVTPLEVCKLSHKELILTDENMDFAFMSVYDSFITLFLSKEENISGFVKLMNWEGFICDNETYINWYLTRTN